VGPSAMLPVACPGSILADLLGLVSPSSGYIRVSLRLGCVGLPTMVCSMEVHVLRMLGRRTRSSAVLGLLSARRHARRALTRCVEELGREAIDAPAERKEDITSTLELTGEEGDDATAAIEITEAEEGKEQEGAELDVGVITPPDAVPQVTATPRPQPDQPHDLAHIFPLFDWSLTPPFLCVSQPRVEPPELELGVAPIPSVDVPLVAPRPLPALRLTARAVDRPMDRATRRQVLNHLSAFSTSTLEGEDEEEQGDSMSQARGFKMGARMGGGGVEEGMGHRRRHAPLLGPQTFGDRAHGRTGLSEEALLEDGSYGMLRQQPLGRFNNVPLYMRGGGLGAHLPVYDVDVRRSQQPLPGHYLDDMGVQGPLFMRPGALMRGGDRGEPLALYDLRRSREPLPTAYYLDELQEHLLDGQWAPVTMEMPPPVFPPLDPDMRMQELPPGPPFMAGGAIQRHQHSHAIFMDEGRRSLSRQMPLLGPRAMGTHFLPPGLDMSPPGLDLIGPSSSRVGGMGMGRDYQPPSLLRHHEGPAQARGGGMRQGSRVSGQIPMHYSGLAQNAHEPVFAQQPSRARGLFDAPPAPRVSPLRAVGGGATSSRQAPQEMTPEVVRSHIHVYTHIG
jgi:hypothetical protein